MLAIGRGEKRNKKRHKSQAHRRKLKRDQCVIKIIFHIVLIKIILIQSPFESSLVAIINYS